MTAPPCAGQWQLFDSTDPYDHERAKALCDACPMIAACREQLAQARKSARSGGMRAEYGPSGTWAGELVGHEGYNPYRLLAEERMFTEPELRQAHRRYARGERDPRTEMGERVYQRKCARRKRERKAAA